MKINGQHMDNLSDIELINNIKRNRDVDDCLRELIDRHSGIYLDMVNSFTKNCNNDSLREEIINEKEYVIYNSVLKYDETKGTKFSTFLHRGVRLQCQKRLNFNKRYKTSQYYEEGVVGKFSQNIKNNSYSQDLKIELKDEIENCEDPDIIYDRFYNNMTLQR